MAAQNKLATSKITICEANGSKNKRIGKVMLKQISEAPNMKQDISANH